MRASRGRMAWAGVTAIAVAAIALLASCGPAASPQPTPPAGGSVATSESAPASASVPPTAPASPSASPGTISGFAHPTNIVAPGDGSDRLFVTDQPGVIRVVRRGVLLHRAALDIRSRVGSSGTEQGLLGLTFPPGYATKGYAYIYFTDNAGDSRVYRIHTSASDPDAFDPGTMQLILAVAQPFANHNGGQLAFGPDGYLYFGLGDGGSEGDPAGRGQSLSTLLGKILRIDTESTPDKAGYRIPPDNPYLKRSGVRPEIWATGLRNPWRFSFDSQTGDLWIGDVGQDSWEEVDRLPAGSRGGANLGWALYEGDHLYKAASRRPGFVWPVAEYSHALGIAITGGYVYRGAVYPNMRGRYVFGDYGSGRIWTLARSGSGWTMRLARNTSWAISTFGVDNGGELWAADWNAGTIHRLGDLSR